MSKFVTKKIDAIIGRQDVQELVVLEDTIDLSKVNKANCVGMLAEYENSLEVKYKPSFTRLLSILNAVSNLKSLDETQFKDVTPYGESVKEYEAKAGDLRLWLIKIPNGKLVVFGGYKNNQKKDFKTFRSLKNQYLKSLNQ